MLSKKGSFFEVGKNTIDIFNTKVDVLYILWFAFIMFLVFFYGYLRCSFKFNDMLSFKLLPRIDGWLISHFLTFAVAGFFFPNTFVLSMAIGILWEMIEWAIGMTKPSFLKGIGDCHHNITNVEHKKFLVSNDNSKNGTTKYWWYGQYEDIVADFAGFIVGKYVLIGLLK